MEWAEVKTYLDANKESDANVKQYLEGFNPLKGLTEDSVHGLVESNIALKSYRDSTVTKGIETWKGNNLQGILNTAVEEEAKKHKTKPETPLEKEVRELKEELAAERKEKALAIQRETLRKKATELGYDPELAEDFVNGDEEAAISKLIKHAKVWGGQEEAIRNKILASGGQPPKSGDPPRGSALEVLDKMTPEQILALPAAEREKLVTAMY